MTRLPLFPLPIVLLPGTVMPLHVFEPRYRSLVRDCLEGDRRFGLLRHDPDEDGPFLFESGRVGTVAEIEAHHPLPDGRSFILVRGAERFSISGEVASDTLYYEAHVMSYADEPLDADAVRRLRARRHWSVERFRAVLATVDAGDDVGEFDTALDVSFALAGHIQIDASWLQALLELRDEERRLDRLDAVFQAALDR